MASQEAMDFFRQLSSNSFGGRNLLHAGLAQTINRTKLAQQQIFPVLAHARAIIENAFADPLFHQELVIGIRKAVRFVANPLQQTQRS